MSASGVTAFASRIVERSSTAPVKLPDAQLHFWSDVYLANPAVRARGVSLEQFLGNPREILVACGTPVVRICWQGALVPASRAMERALNELAAAVVVALERTGARCENGRFVEKLRHHSYTKCGPRRDLEKH